MWQISKNRQTQFIHAGIEDTYGTDAMDASVLSGTLCGGDNMSSTKQIWFILLYLGLNKKFTLSS